ncbi:MAG: hypothetical protein JO273_20225 [Methylobacteriaceae bacterium]|nr:hypothetical protein [Methylobacteriaceae bacterium]
MRSLPQNRALARPRQRLKRASPEDMLLAWLIALPDGADPAQAARDALAQFGTPKCGTRQIVRLRELLVEVSRHRPLAFVRPSRRAGRLARSKRP